MVSIHVKKNFLFFLYLLFNAGLSAILILVDNGFVYVSLFILGGHVRDFLNVVYQLLNICKIVRKLPDIPEEEKNTICCLIPVYNEDANLVEKNMRCLTTQNLSKNTDVFLMIIFDGLNDKNRKLFGYLEKIIKFEKSSVYDKFYENWKSKSATRLIYKVGVYNNTPVVLAYKSMNSGKKDSLIMGEKFCMEISGIDSISMEKVDFIYHTDGDTASDENCLNELLKSLVHDKDLDGVSGILRAYGKESNTFTERAFVKMQDFQYLFSLIVRRATESLMNTTTCLPGCCNMVRMGRKTDFAIEKYSSLPLHVGNLLQTITRMQGTDRRYTTLLLKQGANLRMNWRAFVHTEPPLNASAFINQRRRWASNSFFNSIILLYSENIPFYIKASTFIDICKIFSTIFRFVSYFCFWIFLSEFTTLNIVLACLFLAIPYLYSFVWIFCIVPEWKDVMVGFLFNKLLMPFLSIVSVSKMYLTSTNFAWGSTAGKKVVKKSNNKSRSIGPVSQKKSQKDKPMVPFSEFQDVGDDVVIYANNRMVVGEKKDTSVVPFSEFQDVGDDVVIYANNRMVVDEKKDVEKKKKKIGVSGFSRKQFQTVHPGLEPEGFEVDEKKKKIGVSGFSRRQFQTVHPGLEPEGFEVDVFVYYKHINNRVRPVESSLSDTSSDFDGEEKNVIGDDNC